MIKPSTFAMAPGSRTTRQSPCINPPADIPEEQDKLASATERTDAGSDETSIPLEAPTPPFVLPSAKDLFTKFMKVFMETTQAQALAELRESTH